MATTKAVKEAIWMRDLLSKLSSGMHVSIAYCNSLGTIHLTKDQMYHERTKYIDIKYHFIRDVIVESNIVVKKIGTIDNLVNMMTKPILVAKFKHYLDLIGIHST